jgi:hypothetical protein
MLTHNIARVRAACLLAVLSLPSAAQVVTVPDDYPTIGEAVAFGMTLDPSQFYSILVRPGTYRENVVVRRGNISIQALGSDVILRGSGRRDTLRLVEATSFQVSGLTITGDGNAIGVGVDRCRLGSVACIAVGNRVGVLIKRSEFCSLGGSSFIGNARTGIRVQDSGQVSMHITEILDNGRYGLELVRACRVFLAKCEINCNGEANVRAVDSEDLSLAAIHALDGGGDGIRMRNVARVFMGSCGIERNAANGLTLVNSRNSTVTLNFFTDNGGWGVLYRNGTGDDFSEGGSITPLPGDNMFSGNGLGPFQVR